MKSYKLFTVLSSLTQKELVELKKYVASPFFNQHQGVIRLMEFLYEEIQTDTIEKLTRESTFSGLFPKEAFDYQRISDLMSYLTKLVEGFLIQKELQADPFQGDYYLARQIRKRDLGKLFQRKIQRIQLSIPDRKDAENQYHHYLLASEMVGYQDQQKKRITDGSFGQMVSYLDQYYLLTRVKFGCGMLNRLDVQSADFDMELVLILVSYLEKHDSLYSDFTLLQVYIRIFRMLQHRDEPKWFWLSHDLLSSSVDTIPPSSLREIYAWLMNYCIHKINNGESDFMTVLFELYEQQLAKDIMLENGWLSPWDYKNIINLGLKIKKFDWTQAFIEKYKEKLQEQFREVAYTYNLAVLYFSTGQYHLSLKLLHGIEFSDLYYQLGAKTILLKIYYERQENESLFYLLDAFEAYLKRVKQISAYQREIYLNLIRFTRKLATIRIKLDSTYRIIKADQIVALQNRIQRTKKIAQSGWILNQVAKLLFKHKKSSKTH